VALEVAGSIPVAHPTDFLFIPSGCENGFLVPRLCGIERGRTGPSGALKIEEREILFIA
jgi:hypothetical protein